MEQLLRLTPARLYFVRTIPERLDYAILAGLILAIGLSAGSLFWLSYRCEGVVRRALETPLAFLYVMGIAHVMHLHLCRYPPLWAAVVKLWNRVGVTAVDGWFIVSVLCGIAAIALISQSPKAMAVAKPMLCGCAAVVWLSGALAVVRPAAPLSTGQGGAPVAGVNVAHEIGPGNPVVWVILDEWDYDLTFRRGDGKTFPEFERLRKQSMFLEHVQAAGKITLLAIPALLMGRPVREYRSLNPSAARFVSNGPTESFPGPRTIFDAARQFGYQSHVVGWYHPYCRIFGAQLASCYWEDLQPTALSPGVGAGARARAFLRESFEMEFLPVLGPGNNILRQMQRIQPMTEQAVAAASHTGRSFSFLHMPVPHSPFFRLAANGEMVPLHSNVEGYQSGLDAADRTLGALRVAMERAGAWDEALVVVSSDHPYRYQLLGGYGNGHIPMIIKFPHQTTGIIYSHAFQAVETRSLIEDFMRGTVATPERALAWLERSAPAAGAKALMPPVSVVSLQGPPQKSGQR